MSSFIAGRQAEVIAAETLISDGYKVLSQNWRTRYCEIDIVASKQSTVYFIEVKYRRKDNWGSGLEYITPQKLKQMRFAAEMWLQQNNWTNESVIAAMELTGQPPTVTAFITDL